MPKKKIVGEFLNPPTLKQQQTLNQKSQYRQIWHLLKSGSAKKLHELPPDLQKIAIRMLRERNHTMAMQRLGLDVGTKNIVLSYRKDNKVNFIREINGFYKMPVENQYAKSMLKQLGIPFIASEDGKHLIALGEQAEKIAVTFGGYLRRPMERGTLSVSEKEAMNIMAVIIRSIVGDLKEDAVLYYCIPADAINAKTNSAFHAKIVQAILDGYVSSSGNKLKAFPINEARALVFSQIPDKTGIGVSFGAGMINISYCLFGMPVYEFSIVGSGDWIDAESARATGNLDMVEGVERPKALVTAAKESIDLRNGIPNDPLLRAIYFHYQLLIEKVTNGIIKGFLENQNKAKAPMAMPIIVAGGTSSPPGFVDMFRDSFKKQEMPFQVGEIKAASNPLYAVSEGCLIVSELHEEQA